MLLWAFAKGLDSTNDHFVIIGRGTLKRKLIRMAKMLGIGENVSIESGMSFQEIAEMYRAADLVVYPSYYEGQGLIPLESMASGTPVVTVDHGPLPEMVDQTVGALFEMGSESSLADAILLASSSRKELLEKGVEGRRRVMDQFNLEGNAGDFLEVYDRAISKSKLWGNS